MKSSKPFRNSATKLGTQVYIRTLKVLIYIRYYHVITLLGNRLATGKNYVLFSLNTPTTASYNILSIKKFMIHA